MQLLVSVRSLDEALAALAGGADIIDAKDPSRGALGAVDVEVFDAIRDAVGGQRPVSAALGDVGDIGIAAATAMAARGAAFVKVGFAGLSDAVAVGDALRRLVRAVGRERDSCAVIAVGYADASRARAIDASELVGIAADEGARGVLVDTADKAGPGLTGLWSVSTISEWVGLVHERGMVASIAGKIACDDIHRLRDVSADVVGVRGAVCVGGRGGTVSAHLVTAMRLVMRSESLAPR